MAGFYCEGIGERIVPSRASNPPTPTDPGGTASIGRNLVRESQPPMPNALNPDPFSRLSHLLLIVLIALIALPASAATASDSAGMADPDWVAEEYRPRPLFIWITPAAGLFGKMLAAGGDLRFALETGWGASAGFAFGNEICVFSCLQAPEKFAAASLLAGFRSVGQYGYGSIAAGPNWGWAERPDTNIVQTLEDEEDPGCFSFLCHDYDDHPKISEEGLGIQVQAQVAMAGKYLGIGGQIQVIYIPQNVYAGITLILPIGLIK